MDRPVRDVENGGEIAIPDGEEARLEPLEIWKAHATEAGDDVV